MPYNSSMVGQKWSVNDDGRISVVSKDKHRFCLSKTDATVDPITIEECGTGPDSAESISQVWELVD